MNRINENTFIPQRRNPLVPRAPLKDITNIQLNNEVIPLVRVNTQVNRFNSGRTNQEQTTIQRQTTSQTNTRVQQTRTLINLR